MNQVLTRRQTRSRSAELDLCITRWAKWGIRLEIDLGQGRFDEIAGLVNWRSRIQVVDFWKRDGTVRFVCFVPGAHFLTTARLHTGSFEIFSVEQASDGLMHAVAMGVKPRSQATPACKLFSSVSSEYPAKFR
jgi:hypothetical protein